MADLATVALIVILFRDGLEVEGEMLQAHWHLPLRKLVLAMPLTAVIVAVRRAPLTSLSWTESFLLGALLSPTDPVLSSSVVTNPRVPRLVRHSLNLESGLNDGLALPAVLALTAALSAGSRDFVWWRFVLAGRDLGFAVGLAVGFLAAALMPRGGPRRRDSRPPAVLYALGTAFADLRRRGAAATRQRADRGLRRARSRSASAGRTSAATSSARPRTSSRSSSSAIFVVFGSLLTLHGLFADGWAAVGDRRWSRCWWPGRWPCSRRSPGTRRDSADARRSWRGSAPRAWRR